MTGTAEMTVGTGRQTPENLDRHISRAVGSYIIYIVVGRPGACTGAAAVDASMARFPQAQSGLNDRRRHEILNSIEP